MAYVGHGYHSTRIILGMYSAIEKRCYCVTPPPIGWAHTQNDPADHSRIPYILSSLLLYQGQVYGLQGISHWLCTWFGLVLIFFFFYGSIIPRGFVLLIRLIYWVLKLITNNGHKFTTDGQSSGIWTHWPLVDVVMPDSTKTLTDPMLTFHQ